MLVSNLDTVQLGGSSVSVGSPVPLRSIVLLLLSSADFLPMPGGASAKTAQLSFTACGLSSSHPPVGDLGLFTMGTGFKEQEQGVQTPLVAQAQKFPIVTSTAFIPWGKAGPNTSTNSKTGEIGSHSLLEGGICGHFYNHLLGVLTCTYKKLHTIVVLNEITYKHHRLHWKCSINISVFLFSIPFQIKKMEPHSK